MSARLPWHNDYVRSYVGVVDDIEREKRLHVVAWLEPQRPHRRLRRWVRATVYLAILAWSAAVIYTASQM